MIGAVSTLPRSNMPPMLEVELKFQVPAAQRKALAVAVATTTATRIALRARYFDTEDRRLAAAGLALRVRKEGRQWVQTLKGAGDGIWQRLEHEVPVRVAAGSAPQADPALHDGSPAGAALRSALGDGVLQPIYGTVVTRTRRLLRVDIADQLVTDRVMNELMGKDASARFRFIMDRAEDAQELDV